MFWKISLSPTYLLSTYCGPGITSGARESILNKSDPPDQPSKEIYTCRRTHEKINKQKQCMEEVLTVWESNLEKGVKYAIRK